MMENDNVLEINNLHTYFFPDQSEVHAVDGVSLKLKRGNTLGIVGESGSGKSITALSIMGLLSGTSAKIVEGEILFDGNDILKLSKAKRRDIRGKKISMIFQEPMTSLNPVLKIGNQLEEAVLLHENVNRKEAQKKSLEMLIKTGIPRAESIMHEYPFQLSGGQRQRVMIAMALICKPQVLIADEPTTALDVTIQAQILDLIDDLKVENGTSAIFITHDLGVVAEICDDVAVMYCGRVVESGSVYDIFENPSHPYTRGLLQSMPTLESEDTELPAIPGNVPDPKHWPVGCKFAPRCSCSNEKCEEEPGFYTVSPGHTSRCWLCQDKDGGGQNE